MCPGNHTDCYANGVVYDVSAPPFHDMYSCSLSDPGYRETSLPRLHNNLMLRDGGRHSLAV